METRFVPEFVQKPLDIRLKLRLIAEMLHGTAAAGAEKFTQRFYPVGRRFTDKLQKLSPYPFGLFRVNPDLDGFTNAAPAGKHRFAAETGEAVPAGDYFVYFDGYYITYCHAKTPLCRTFRFYILLYCYFAGFIQSLSQIMSNE
jgi:hypothetical protein